MKTKIQTPAVSTPTKTNILAALRAFVAQRSGIDYGNYGERSAFMSDYRPILREGREARTLLRSVELRDSITPQDIIAASERAFSGRLTFTFNDSVTGAPRENGSVGVSYCTGQYFPTEYRAAACAVLAACLWAYFRANMPTPDAADRDGNPTYAGRSAGEYIRWKARQEFGRGIQSRWFN